MWVDNIEIKEIVKLLINDNKDNNLLISVYCYTNYKSIEEKYSKYFSIQVINSVYCLNLVMFCLGPPKSTNKYGYLVIKRDEIKNYFSNVIAPINQIMAN